ncbi:formin-like protein 5 [Pipra filicauda]|uniref:Formin-like protein 5 n=1 Tax=Pipra filicauda TaxID=649802 RepID=A0A6J2H5Y5_9PASS|nr:formin-like protein 5 [Pipra filicauda]
MARAGRVSAGASRVPSGVIPVSGSGLSGERGPVTFAARPGHRRHRRGEHHGPRPRPPGGAARPCPPPVQPRPPPGPPGCVGRDPRACVGSASRLGSGVFPPRVCGLQGMIRARAVPPPRVRGLVAVPPPRTEPPPPPGERGTRSRRSRRPAWVRSEPPGGCVWQT